MKANVISNKIQLEIAIIIWCYFYETLTSHGSSTTYIESYQTWIELFTRLKLDFTIVK